MVTYYEGGEIMDKTVAIVEFLRDWQNISYEEVDSAEDIKVFNVVGTLVQLVSNNYMSIGSIFDFVEDNLSVESEVKERVLQIVSSAYESVNIVH
jgi:hypothetical protein